MARNPQAHAPGLDTAQGEIPIQPVDKPILCSPYVEPDLHWVYDRQTGVPTRTQGRRPASYWYKTERTGSAQQQLAFMAEEERDDLPLVNALRADVRRWRAAHWPGASETSKTLLRHWWREDRFRRLFFCQLEAVETIIYLREMLASGRTPRFSISNSSTWYRPHCDSNSQKERYRSRTGTCLTPNRKKSGSAA